MSAVSDEDRAMAVLMNGCWVAFAKTGRPDCPGGQAWPAYSRDADTLLEFGRETGLRTGFQAGRLDFQEARALPGLALP
jgi:para-nitrobenzyl esterase